MPDLAENSVRRHWAENSTTTAKLLYAMEEVEHWTLDGHPVVLDAVTTFGDRLDIALDLGAFPSFGITNNSEQMLVILAYIKSGRAMRLLQWIEEAMPGYIESIVATARQMSHLDFAKLLLDRLQAIERNHLLRAMFSPSNLDGVCALLQEIQDA